MARNIPYVIHTKDGGQESISVPGHIVGGGVVAIIQYAGFNLHDVALVRPVT